MEVMKEIGGRLAKLIDLKSLITLGLVAEAIRLVDSGRLDVKDFIPIVLMIITFYFNRKKEEGSV